MDRIMFNIDRELKLNFQIQTLKDEKTMSDVLVELIKKYLEEKE